MKERQIPFSGEMVRAILDGRKTVTRRVVKPQPVGGCHPFDVPEALFKDGMLWFHEEEYPGEGAVKWTACPYGGPGDRLWVKETFCTWKESQCGGYGGGTWKIYKADNDMAPPKGKVWKSSRFMPRCASRITLEVTGVRVERVQEITEAGVRREGLNEDMVPVIKSGDIVFPDTMPYRFVHWITGFKVLWDSLNAKRGFGWDKNPWVWVIEFRRVENVRPHDQ